MLETPGPILESEEDYADKYQDEDSSTQYDALPVAGIVPVIIYESSYPKQEQSKELSKSTEDSYAYQSYGVLSLHVQYPAR